MKTPPKVGSLVKVSKIPKGWAETGILDKVGIVRELIPTFGKRTVIMVEFVSWEKGHKGLFQQFTKNVCWFFYNEHLELAI